MLEIHSEHFVNMATIDREIDDFSRSVLGSITVCVLVLSDGRSLVGYCKRQGLKDHEQKNAAKNDALSKLW